MKYTYCAIFTTEDQGGYSITFPDIPSISSHARDLKSGIFKAQEVLSFCLFDMLERGENPPHPSYQHEMVPGTGEMPIKVTVDASKFSTVFNKKLVRQKVSIPGWLEEKAQESGVDLNQALELGIRHKLGISGLAKDPQKPASPAAATKPKGTTVKQVIPPVAPSFTAERIAFEQSLTESPQEISHTPRLAERLAMRTLPQILQSPDVSTSPLIEKDDAVKPPPYRAFEDEIPPKHKLTHMLHKRSTLILCIIVGLVILGGWLFGLLLFFEGFEMRSALDSLSVFG